MKRETAELVRRVVVIEDDPDLCRALAFALEIEGFAVRCHHDAESYLRAVPWSEGCLVVDHLLPGMSGLELIVQLAGRGRRTPAILITTHPTRSLLNQAAGAGVPIVEKPLLGNGLADAIHEAFVAAARL